MNGSTVNEAPVTHTCTVVPEWIDYNGHMNVAWYVYAFDAATVNLMGMLGMDDHYRANSGHTTFALECHILYRRELVEGDPIRITSQLLDYDDKRMHYFHAMYHGEQGYLAATLEQLSVHVEKSGPRSAPLPGNVVTSVAAMHDAHRHLPRPAEVGRSVGIRRK